MKKIYLKPKSTHIALGAEQLIATSLGKNDTIIDGNDNSGSGGNDNSQWTQKQSGNSLWDTWSN